jgi:hypothetical protein
MSHLSNALVTRLKTVVACTLLAHVLAIAALAANPQLHEWIHSEAGHQGHVCAITLFADGACDSMCSAPILVGLVGFALSDSLPSSSNALESFYLACRILEHAPPANS